MSDESYAAKELYAKEVLDDEPYLLKVDAGEGGGLGVKVTDQPLSAGHWGALLASSWLTILRATKHYQPEIDVAAFEAEMENAFRRTIDDTQRERAS